MNDDFEEFEEEELQEDEIWKPEPDIEEDSFVKDPIKKFQVADKALVLPSAFTEYTFRMPDPLAATGFSHFSFEGRRHMKYIYDRPFKRILLCTARQVEKTCGIDSYMYDKYNKVIHAKDVKEGSYVGCLDATTSVDTKLTNGKVSWVSRIYTKPGIRIRTHMGQTLELGEEHPVRCFNQWVKAQDVKVGDRVAGIRCLGEFANIDKENALIELIAFMLGDGGTRQRQLIFTTATKLVLDRFTFLLTSINNTYSIRQKKGEAIDLRIHVGKLLEQIEKDGLLGKYSYEKTIPDWVFSLSREQTALFLNRLWATDGHCKIKGSRYAFEYCSTSKLLAFQVQALLWKFGIPSHIRENQPSYISKTGQKARLAYILRIVSQPAVRTFLTEIGALGKTEHLTIPDIEENNNRDTYPIEIEQLIQSIFNSHVDRPTILSIEKSIGIRLRYELQYAPSKRRVQEYVAYFRSDEGYDQTLVDTLESYIDTDIFWDKVKSVESIEELECIDFSVDTHENFIVNGVVTHNSTLLGNMGILYCCFTPAYKVLYVSPSAQQTKMFSNDRVKEPIETSPVLKKFTSSMLSANILEKQFINRAKYILRYAFLNADRTRGIAGNMLQMDEFQDILSDNIPVIEQCLSHSPEAWKRFLYTGTPKSLDNNLEFYRSQQSTQGEWAVPCDAHTPKYWNILGENNIGKKGLICDKCGKLIDPMHEKAQWVKLVDEAPFESYRITQLMVPWKLWDEILLDYERYPRDKFFNEVLGLSYDSGLRPLTMGQLQACCNPDIYMVDAEKYRPLSFGNPIFAGIDWGGGSWSYTVITLATYVGTKFRIIYQHRFTGEDMSPEVQHQKIYELLKFFNVRYIGADYGGGFASNDFLVRRFGPQRVFKYQYITRGKRKVEWDSKLGRFKLNRTEVMSDIFNSIKRNQCEFPRWEEFKNPFAMDMLAIVSEYNETLKMIQYQHSLDKPDDTFHSLVYCWLASMVYRPRIDIIAPRREDSRGVMENIFSPPGIDVG